MLLGRKIIEDYPDDSPLGTPKSKSPGLTIEVEKCGLGVKRNRLSRDRASFVRTRGSLSPGISPLYTPDSSHTFGVPNITTVASASQSEDSYRNGTRRKRSSLAEQALASTLQSCSAESSPKEVQIRVLEQATALICAHAIDAQEDSEADKESLLEREAEELDTRPSSPSESTTVEQHRLAFDFESQLLRRHLQHLSQVYGMQRGAGVERSDQLSKDDRHLANLARFLQTSLTWASMAISRKRRRTMDDMDLSWPQACRKSLTFEGLSRTMSLDDKVIAARSRRAEVRSWLLSGRRARSVVVPEPVLVDESRPEIPFPATESIPPSQPATNAERPKSARRPKSSRRRHSMDDLRLEHLKGNVSIYQSTLALSKINILTDLGTREVQIPQYAKELIDDLDYFVDRIPLELITMSIGYHLSPSSPSVPEDDSPPSTNEEHQCVSDGDDDDDEEDDEDDIISESSFGILSTSASHFPPSTTTQAPSLFRSVFNKARATVRPRPPTIARKASFFSLLHRARADIPVENRSNRSRTPFFRLPHRARQDVPADSRSNNRGETAKRFMFGWFRR